MEDILNFEEMDNETREMLNSFVSESFDSLDSSEHLIEEIREDGDNETVNAIFRVFHTLKGLSGFFGMYVINKVTHEAETLLDIIRKNSSKINEEVIAVIYTAYDFLRELVNRVSTDFTDKSGLEEAEDFIIIIKDVISKVQNPALSETFFLEDNIITETVTASSPELSFFMDGEEEIQTEVKKTEVVTKSNNEFMSHYIEGAYELIEIISDNLINLEKDTFNGTLIANTFGAVHSLKGNSGFMGLPEIEEISMDMETILDSVRNHELDLNETIISILLSNLEMISTRIGKLGSETADNSFNNSDLDNSEIVNAQITGSIEKETEINPPLPLKNTAGISKSENQQNDDIKKTALNLKKELRVDTAKIDRLFDLVGELITIETMVTSNPDLKGLILPNFIRSANMLNKITRELQEVTMSVRMTPLEGLFNKMKRLVRDVSIKMNKKVDLLISGQETEMDKNIIDEISDPLVHLIRNSIDHGIELPQERIAKGKSETGTVSLSAKYVGNEILITIKDDGNGLNKEKILSKAIEKGLVESHNDKLSEKDIYRLIFEPGFSTADKVTDISGRGVGMDVVKKNIEKLRGTIDIESIPNSGSSIILRIPLTLAIIESMIFRIGQARYAMPILSVVESLKITPDKITRTMDGLELAKVRNDLLPVVRLYELFHKTPASVNLEDGLLVIVESRERKVCLFVDEIIGQQQAVVKSLTDYIGKVPGVTGCMILGDGGIGLILDIESIVDLSEKNEFKYLSDKNRATA